LRTALVNHDMVTASTWRRHHLHFFLFFEHEGFHLYEKIIYYRQVKPKKGPHGVPGQTLQRPSGAAAGGGCRDARGPDPR
jgi:hypothetical protein